MRILDLSQAYAGPFCTMNLADHGAEVIKIERPGVGDQVRTWGPMKNGESGFHACLNRNKSGITLDLKSEEGKEVFRRLLKTADVVCENYKVGVLEKLGFSPIGEEFYPPTGLYHPSDRLQRGDFFCPEIPVYLD